MATTPCRDCGAQVSLASRTVEALCPSCGAMAPAATEEGFAKLVRVERYLAGAGLVACLLGLFVILLCAGVWSENVRSILEVFGF